MFNVHYGLFTNRFISIPNKILLLTLGNKRNHLLLSWYVSQKIGVQLDTKHFGGKAWEYLNSLQIHVNVTQADCQGKRYFFRKIY